MNIEKIEINGHYVWADKDAEIDFNEYYISCFSGKILQRTKKMDIVEVMDNKIIAASPELNLEGVPTYVEWLAEQEYREYPNNPKDKPEWYYNRDINCFKKRKVFVKGYRAAEKELYTEDDVRKAIEMARDQYWDVDNRGFSTQTDGDWSFKHSEEEIIEQLKQTKQ
jgi:hypothetical protein